MHLSYVFFFNLFFSTPYQEKISMAIVIVVCSRDLFALLKYNMYIWCLLWGSSACRNI